MSSPTRLLVLGVVRIFQPVHGYDVRRELRSWRAETWANVAPGSIYNALKSMARDGLVEVVGTDQVGGRPERTSYRLTAEGEREFGRLVREAFWAVAPSVDPLMPALSFIWTLRREEAIAALEHRIQALRGEAERARLEIARLDDPHSRDQVALMLDLAARRATAELPWAEELVAKLRAGEYTFADERAPAEPTAR